VSRPDEPISYAVVELSVPMTLEITINSDGEITDYVPDTEEHFAVGRIYTTDEKGRRITLKPMSDDHCRVVDALKKHFYFWVTPERA
jgi:hypothetical protein